MKDNLGDITLSDNYRTIAGGCLLLELIDLVMLMLEGDKLNFDATQFVYQRKSRTSMFTRTVTEVVDHFNQGGMPVFRASMDMSEAFNMVEWSELFFETDE